MNKLVGLVFVHIQCWLRRSRLDGNGGETKESPWGTPSRVMESKHDRRDWADQTLRVLR